MAKIRQLYKILILTLSIMLTVVYSCWAAQQICTVTEDVVNVRSGPDTTYEVVDKASRGQVYNVLESKGDWYKVQMQGQTGWIAGWLVSVDGKAGADDPNAEYADKKAVVNEDIVNVRSAPGTDNTIVGKVYKGQSLSVCQKSGDWYQVEGQSVKGWVAGWLVDIADKANDKTTDKPDITEPPSNGSDNVDVGGSSILSFLLDEDEHDGNSGNSGDNSQSPGGSTSLSDSDIKFNDSELALGSGAIDFTSLADTTAYVICEDVNIRAKANAESEIIGKVNFKDTIEIIGKEGDFFKVKLTDGSTGWVADFLVAAIYKDSTASGDLSGKSILIDAGHGEITQIGVDPGSLGRVTGVYERDITIDVAHKTKDKLISEGAVVIMVRTGESTMLTKKGRANTANYLGTDIFVSIHTNSNDKTTPNGTSTYYYAPESNSLLYSQRNQRNALATAVQSALLQSAGRKDLGVLQENFAVIRETKMPSILIETAFISNAEEEVLLRDESFRDKLAVGIKNGIIKYFK